MIYANLIIFCRQPFFTGIVKELFDMCQVGNIRLKSVLMGGKHDLIENESRTTQFVNGRFF